MIVLLRRFGVVLLLVGLAACQTLPSVNDRCLPNMVAIEDGSAARIAMNARVYDASIAMVTRRFYDRAYNGVDFGAEAASRRAEAVAQPDEAGFYRKLNETLRLLDDRHTVAVRPSVNRARSEARLAQTTVYGMAITLAKPTAASEVHYVISRLRQDGPAAQAGVQVGWRIRQVDGEAYDIERSYGDSLRVFTFEDAEGHSHDITMTARPLPREVGAAVRRPDGVLVLHFAEFDQASRDWILARLAEAESDPPSGIVIDLRQNIGGRINDTARIIGAFFDERIRFAHYNLGPVAGVPRRTVSAREPWTGPLAVLQSDQSGSAAEVFAAAVQEQRRGPVVGQTSAGAVVGAIAYQLPDGGLLRVGVSEFRTGSGAILEKVGVTPDIQITPTYEDLIRSRDVMLEAAVAAMLGVSSGADDTNP